MRRTPVLLCTFVFCIATPLSASAKPPKGAEPPKTTQPNKAPTDRVGLLLKVESTQLTLKTYGKLPTELLVPVDNRTLVEIEGKPATVADLKPGMDLLVSPPNGTAQKIQAHKEGKKKKKDKKDKTPPPSAPADK
jgi:hypothetical protein